MVVVVVVVVEGRVVTLILTTSLDRFWDVLSTASFVYHVFIAEAVALTG